MMMPSETTSPHSEDGQMATSFHAVGGVTATSSHIDGGVIATSLQADDGGMAISSHADNSVMAPSSHADGDVMATSLQADDGVMATSSHIDCGVMASSLQADDVVMGTSAHGDGGVRATFQQADDGVMATSHANDDMKSISPHADDDVLAISSLPDEVLLNIFSHFSRSEVEASVLPVCKRWDAIGRDSKPFRKLEVVNDSFFSFSRYENLNEDIKNSPKLRSLVLKNVRIGDMTGLLYLVGTYCPSLESLHSNHHGPISLESMKFVADACKNLSQLTLSITAMRFLSSVSMPNVKSIQFVEEFNSNIQENLLRLNQHDICELPLNFPRMDTLQILSKFISEELIYFLLTHLKNRLRVLEVKFKVVRSIERIIDQLTSCHSLESLAIEYEHRTDVIHFMMLVNRLKNLSVLELKSFCLESPQTFSQDVIKMTGCNNVQQKIRASLVLGELKFIAVHFPGLRELTLANYLSRLDELSPSLQFPELQELSLEHCHTLTDDWLTLFIKKCPKLRKFSLRYFNYTQTNFTGIGLLNIRTVLPLLEEIELMFSSYSNYCYEGSALQAVSTTNPGVRVKISVDDSYNCYVISSQ